MSYGETPNYGLRYPNPDEDVDIAGDLQQLATDTDAALGLVSGGGTGGGVSTLDELTDVDVAFAAEGQVLAYQAGVWKPADGGSGSGATTLGGLSDVDTTTTAPATGQGLVYDAATGLWSAGNVAAARQPGGMIYRGDWATGAYVVGDVVNHEGGLWLCTADSSTTPAIGSGGGGTPFYTYEFPTGTVTNGNGWTYLAADGGTSSWFSVQAGDSYTSETGALPEPDLWTNTLTIYAMEAATHTVRLTQTFPESGVFSYWDAYSAPARPEDFVSLKVNGTEVHRTGHDANKTPSVGNPYHNQPYTQHTVPVEAGVQYVFEWSYTAGSPEITQGPYNMFWLGGVQAAPAPASQWAQLAGDTSGGGSTVGNLDDLGDVTISALTGGQVLTYNATTAQWEPATPAAGADGGATALDHLSDVDTTTATPVAGQVLKYSGGQWRPAADTGATTLDQLSDVDTAGTPPTAGQTLVWDGTRWAPGNVSGESGATTLDGLTDVDVSTTAPAAGQSLVFTGTQWEPATVSSGEGATTLDALTDVDTTTAAPTSGQLLGWNGTQWVPVAAPSGGGSTTQDTGWRLVTNSFGVSGKTAIRRTGNTVHLSLLDISMSSTYTVGIGVYEVTDGFKPTSDLSINRRLGAVVDDAATSVRVVGFSGSRVTMFGVQANIKYGATFSYPTSDAWPATLPGTAA